MADLAKEESAKEVENVIKNSGIMFIKLKPMFLVTVVFNMK